MSDIIESSEKQNWDSHILNQNNPHIVDAWQTGAFNKTPLQITKGTNILTLDPGYYKFEDETATDQDWLDMGFPRSMWHTEFQVLGSWSDATKTKGYLQILLADMTNNMYYYNFMHWDAWRGWAMVYDSSHIETLANTLYDNYLSSKINNEYKRMDGQNDYVNLTGGDGNTSGYRQVWQSTFGTWTNCRAVYSIRSRHQGSGLLVIEAYTQSTISDYKVDIRYYGPEAALHENAWQVYYNPSTGVCTLYWYFYDYSPAYITVLENTNFHLPQNGTWMTTIPSDAGTQHKMLTSSPKISTTDLTAGSSALQTGKMYLVYE